MPYNCKHEDAYLSELVGKTLKSVTNYHDERIEFITTDGVKYEMYHPRDCCESVYVESIVGDLSDLVGEPILLAEEATSSVNPQDASKEITDDQDSSHTWTFYKFATRKGYVDIRWYGSSNGYYSESVDFVKEVPYVPVR